MLEYFWKGAHKDAGVGQEQAHASSTPPITQPTSTQASTTQILKRKRGQSSPVSPLWNVIQTMSHVEIPGPSERKTPDEVQSRADGFVQQLSASTPIESIPRIQSAKLLTTPVDPSPVETWPNRSKPLDHPVSLQADPSVRLKLKRRPSLATLQDKVEEQLSLETLFKHKELRLIEQELAKCQTAYEQLRRCHIISYPSQSSDIHDMVAVDEGSGDALHNKAPHAPPWGVADGPYTRHYERWLLSDPSFDESTHIDTPTTPLTAGKRLSDRQTRGMYPEKGIYGSHSRVQRSSTAGRLQSLPQTHPEQKEEKGPMVVERKSDRHSVKLVCIDCHRSNFNSVQGFINHCRIAHARQFASHDAAIEASGEELSAESDNGLVSEPSISRGTATAGLVHPMIWSARPFPPETFKPKPLVESVRSNTTDHLSPPKASGSATNATPTRNLSSALPSTTFKASPQAPYLSALLAKSGQGGDLDSIVTDAKTRDEINLIEAMETEDSSDDEVEDSSTQSLSRRAILQSNFRPASSAQPTTTHGLHSNYQTQTPSQSSTHRFPAPVRSTAYQSSFSNDSPGFNNHSSSLGDATPSNLSPNTTDPHPAPSLVSDDDYDNTHSESETASQMDLDMDNDHFLQPDFVDQDELELGESSGFNIAHDGKEQGPPMGRQSRPLTDFNQGGRQQRHVSFASPIGRDKKGARPAAE